MENKESKEKKEVKKEKTSAEKVAEDTAASFRLVMKMTPKQRRAIRKVGWGYVVSGAVRAIEEPNEKKLELYLKLLDALKRFEIDLINAEKGRGETLSK